MPPNFFQPAKVRSLHRATGKMDGSIDMNSEDASAPQNHFVSDARLIDLFELQQERLNEIVREELNTRIPLHATEATNERPSTVWSHVHES